MIIAEIGCLRKIRRFVIASKYCPITDEVLRVLVLLRTIELNITATVKVDEYKEENKTAAQQLTKR